MYSSAEVALTVGEEHTAPAVGSGDVPVLATPWLVAICEQATVAAVAPLLDAGETSVGIAVDIEHLAASAVGAGVVAAAHVLDITDRKVECSVTAHEGDRLVGRGTVIRARVDRERFIERLENR